MPKYTYILNSVYTTTHSRIVEEHPTMNHAAQQAIVKAVEYSDGKMNLEQAWGNDDVALLINKNPVLPGSPDIMVVLRVAPEHEEAASVPFSLSEMLDRIL